MKLIDKDALVAEIERLVNNHDKALDYEAALEDMRNFIDTLEVKSLQEAPVSIDFEKELYKAFGQVKDFTLGIAIAKRFYDMGRKHNEPVSEELEQEIDKYVNIPDNQGLPDLRRELSDCARHFAKWQKQQDQSTIELAEDHAYFAGRTKTIEEIEEKLLSEVLPCFMHGGEADEVVAKLDEVLNQKK